MGPEIVAAVGFLIAWAVGKARRVGKQVDDVADQVVDAASTRLREVLLRKLSADSALRQLELEAESGDVRDRTTQRVTLSLTDAVEQDTVFATKLRSALADARGSGVTFTTSDRIVVNGPVTASGHGHGIAFGVVGGDAHIRQAPNPHQPDRA
ncbi:hypothetical protein ACIOD2_49470 [Amycolatopsis sp. NPDC088138]|uniref:hypothetical protein n=1 Tax=Amycolatopsis sp. NPDC088138 TaxID=3363938 RepID=UPI00380717B0